MKTSRARASDIKNTPKLSTYFTAHNDCKRAKLNELPLPNATAYRSDFANGLGADILQLVFLHVVTSDHTWWGLPTVCRSWGTAWKHDKLDMKHEAARQMVLYRRPNALPFDLFQPHHITNIWHVLLPASLKGNDRWPTMQDLDIDTLFGKCHRMLATQAKHELQLFNGESLLPVAFGVWILQQQEPGDVLEMTTRLFDLGAASINLLSRLLYTLFNNMHHLHRHQVSVNQEDVNVRHWCKLLLQVIRRWEIYSLAFDTKKQLVPEPTPEQQSIINIRLTEGTAFKVVASPGSGKTFLVTQYAKRYPEQQFVYIVFNKSMQLEADEKFKALQLKNIISKTLHSLAFSAVGFRYANCPGKLGGELTVNDVRKVLLDQKVITKEQVQQDDDNKDSNSKGATLQAIVTKTLERFICSFDAAPNDYHIPQVSTHDAALVLRWASTIWVMMQDMSDTTIRMHHDGYQKLAQLENRISLTKYDIVAVDEAQDMTPCQMSIISSQRHAGILMIGDPRQAIYQFRGARDALRQRLPYHSPPSNTPNKPYTLSVTHRLPRDVAEVANSMLRFIGDGVTLEASRHRQPIVSLAERPTSGGYTVITRSNAALIKEALDAVERGLKIGIICTESNKNSKPGETTLRLKLVEYLYGLYSNNRPGYHYPTLPKHVKSFSDIKTYLKDHNVSGELKLLFQEVENRGHDTPEFVSRVRSSLLPWAEAMHQPTAIVLCTAHKSKGMEFDNVVLTDDYIDFTSLIKNQQAMLTQATTNQTARVEQRAMQLLSGIEKLVKPRNVIEDINILYVAATRAKRTLVMNKSLRCLYSQFYHPPVWRLKEIGVTEVTVLCANCKAGLQPGDLYLNHTGIDDHSILCCKCSSHCPSTIAQLFMQQTSLQAVNK